MLPRDFISLECLLILSFQEKLLQICMPYIEDEIKQLERLQSLGSCVESAPTTRTAASADSKHSRI